MGFTVDKENYQNRVAQQIAQYESVHNIHKLSTD